MKARNMHNINTLANSSFVEVTRLSVRCYLTSKDASNQGA